ncbi:MAG: class I SAM-dependent methyltransferase [Bacteroidota bacterium]
MQTNSTTRFSDRVENYIKYRPGYPPEVLSFFKDILKLKPESIIADIGSGTGISAEIFLKSGNRVVGIEPNREMREAAENLLKEYPLFKSIDATAENTMLPENSVDFVIAAQAFHWFDVEKSRAEFKRILKENGWCVFLWNDRRVDSTPFLKEYDELLKTDGIDYTEVNHQNITEEVFKRFFKNYEMQSFKNEQIFDFAALKGRLLSSSYAPAPGHPNHAPMMEKLLKIFEKYAESGKVRFEYDTKIYYGRL